MSFYFDVLRFAFIEFSSPDEAACAYDAMSGRKLHGRQITVDFDSGSQTSHSVTGGGRRRSSSGISWNLAA